MSGSFSPTGYWAHYVHTNDYVEMGGDPLTTLPVIGTSGGVAQVINRNGRTTDVDRVFPPSRVELLAVLPHPTLGE